MTEQKKGEDSEPIMPLRSELLYEMNIDVDGMQFIGEMHRGKRIVGEVTGGTFEGPRMKGKILPGGADWVVQRADGVRVLDVRFTLETDDGALIYVSYPGYLHGPKEILKEEFTTGNADPNDYYVRSTPVFETSAEKYDWLNRSVAVGVGRALAGNRIAYTVHEIL